jgi:two-component system probable response regulator PhcQ
MIPTLADAATTRPTILFVDDEPLSRKYFKASIGQYANVLTAGTAGAALEIMASEGEAISVVVSDERMPHESGVSFLANVRKSWPSAVRILTSAYANIDNLQEAINGAAIYRFVPKPWDLNELCSAMQEALVAERIAEQATAPLQGGARAREAETANLELLAVLTRELAAPLSTLDKEAGRLAILAGMKTITPPHSAESRFATWASQLRLGNIVASTMRMQRDIQHCQALAGSIADLARGLCGPKAAPTSSMAETASAALEQIALGSASRRRITLDARQDFRYRAPKKVMSFVLVELMQCVLRQPETGAPTEIAVMLSAGADSNEVRITSSLASANREPSRAVHCALWAFGGELLHAHDKSSGFTTTVMRLPKAGSPGDVSPR